MTKTLAIIHTTSATIEPLKALAAEILPGYEVINFVDDSILPQLARNKGNIGEVEERLVQYARIASSTGADAILEACSSVGRSSPRWAKQCKSLLYGSMMRWRKRLSNAARALVWRRLWTTLNPTMRLLQAKAAAAGKQIELKTALAESAYRKLMAGIVMIRIWQRLCWNW